MDRQTDRHLPKRQKQARSRSLVKVTKFQSALRLLLMNKYKKFEDNAIDRFCCSVDNSKKVEEKNKKNHGDRFNHNVDQEYLSVNNYKVHN